MSRSLAAFASELGIGGDQGSEVHAAMCRCVSRIAGTLLKPEYADALRSVDVEGQAVKEFATKAGITSNNAAVHLFRARTALRRQVERSYRACAAHGCSDCTCGEPDKAS